MELNIADKKWFWPLAILLLLIGLLFNLGIVPLYNEEPRRALIALEMMYNNNFIVPTQMGVPYFYKTPLFNWLLVLSYKVFGEPSEFASRIIGVICLLIMGGVNYLFVKRYFGKRLAAWCALFFVVSADIFFFFSMLAEIDLLYSMLVFTSFAAAYHFYKQDRWWWFYLAIYGLNGVAFLAKGFPSIVFCVVTVGTFILFGKRWKKLLHPAHFVGVLLFLIIAGGYLLVYQQHFDSTKVVNGLWTQSTHRAFWKSEWYMLPKHMFLRFPSLLLKDLMPATLFLLVFIKKEVRKAFWANHFMRFTLLLVLCNFFVYWISPGTKSRYLYMHYPLLINMLVWAYFTFKDKIKWYKNAIEITLGIAMLVGAAGALAIRILPIVMEHKIAPMSPQIAFLVWSALAYAFIQIKKSRLALFGLYFITARIVFDAIVLPIRMEDGFPADIKRDTQEIAAIVGDTPVFFYGKKNQGQLPYHAIYYTERYTGRVTKKAYKKDLQPATFYIGFKKECEALNGYVHYAFKWKKFDYVLFTINKERVEL